MLTEQERREHFGRISLIFIVFALVLIAAMAYIINHTDNLNNTYSFSEKYVEMTDGWTVSSSVGKKTLTLPAALSYGADGDYTIEKELTGLPDLILSPVVGFYSNYTDFSIYLDDVLLLSFPDETPIFTSGTGNTWHFVRLPADYVGKTLRIEIHCQLGDGVTYTLKPVLIGAKASILLQAFRSSAVTAVLACCLILAAFVLAVMYYVLRRKLGLNRTTIFLALFAIFFAVYILCESSFAKMIVPNGQLLYFLTFVFLAMIPVPLIGFFSCDFGEKFHRIPVILIVMCFINLYTQMILHFTGIVNLRQMVPFTHGTFLVSIVTVVGCLLMTDKKKYPGARIKLLSSIPMMVGGCVDILLIDVGKPSTNNSLWSVVGVTVFIFIQFGVFLGSYFIKYRNAVETEVLMDMAYRDMLTDIGNRNAYERKLKELGASPAPEDLCCMVLDINDLKYINDTYGHQIGDVAIKITGAVLDELLPSSGQAFRTGGDEFVVLMNGMTMEGMASLADTITAEAAARGRKVAIPLSLAVGSGRYVEKDGNVQDFIRRVDSLMYEKKRVMKEQRHTF